MELSTISIVSDNLAPEFPCRRLLRDQERQPLTRVSPLCVLEAYFFRHVLISRHTAGIGAVILCVIANPNQIIPSKGNIVHCRRWFEAS